MFVCGHYDVQTLTSPPVLKLWDTQGYLWLPYDLTEVIKLIGERFEPKKLFFQKITLCHSFRISVIPSVLLSFLPDFCHSFRICVIPSRLVSFLSNIVIPSKLLPFQIFVILNSSNTLPYPKGEKNGHRRWPYMRVFTNNLATFDVNILVTLDLYKIQTRGSVGLRFWQVIHVTLKASWQYICTNASVSRNW